MSLLPDGRVLVAGGVRSPDDAELQYPVAEIYDPLTDKWSRAAQFNEPRAKHQAFMVGSSLLVTGGYGGVRGEVERTTIERYDVEGDRWETVADTRRAPPVGWPAKDTVALGLGDFLLVGGFWVPDEGCRGEVGGASYILSSLTWEWSAGPSLNDGRVRHALTRLSDGSLLAVGGDHPREVDGRFGCEVFGDTYHVQSERTAPDRSAFRRVGDLTIPRDFTRTPGNAQLLPLSNGDAILAGGALYEPKTAIELFRAASDSWEVIDGGTQAMRRYPLIQELSEGLVVIAGGLDGEVAKRSSDVYDPASSTWYDGGAMHGPHSALSASLVRLPGQSGVLLVGSGSAEVFEIASDVRTAIHMPLTLQQHSLH